MRHPGPKSVRLTALAFTMAAASFLTKPADAQDAAARPSLPPPTHDRPLGWYEAPGGYGMSWGTPSYGSVRTYSEFASPYGKGYGYGYAPSTILPGPFGAGIWRPGSPAATVFDSSTASRESYRTFQVPFVKGSTHPVPPVGAYAPAFGPNLPGR